ncbi:hypothetical protein ACLB2K_029755 [Fragaria x ananassa]
MAASTSGRSLEQTPTWAVAVVCFVLVLISIIIEHILELIGKWLKNKHKRALFEALEKVKSELMLLGFISLLLTVGQGPISNICISEKVGNTWHPCSKKQEKKIEEEEEVESPSRRLLAAFESGYGGGSVRRVLAAAGTDKCAAKGKVPFISADGIHQLHIFIFVLAIFHVLYCILTMALGRAKVCFFRQFVRSVPKVDYLTLRHGFIMAHLAPQSHEQFNFQKYINRSLEEDFKVVVGISPPIWCFAVIFLLFNTHGWYSYLWLPFIPLIIILLVGTKLQVIITKMGLRIQERGEVVKGTPVVQPGDDLFWFNRPRLILYLINFVLFQNAFQLAFFAWSWMGSTMKPTIFNERVATALRNWHHTAKKHIKQNKGSVTPMSSRPGTPSHHASPIHLLRHYRSEVDSFHTSPRRSNFDVEQRYETDSPSPSHHLHIDGLFSHQHHVELGNVEHDRMEVNEPNSGHATIRGSQSTREQHEINIGPPKDFSFDKRQEVDGYSDHDDDDYNHDGDAIVEET